MKKFGLVVTMLVIAMAFSTSNASAAETLILNIRDVNAQDGKIRVITPEVEIDSWGRIHEGQVYIAADYFNVIVDEWSYDPKTKVEYVDVGDVRVYLSPARIERAGQQLSTPEEVGQLEAGFIPLRNVYELAGYTVHYEQGMIYIY